MKLLDSLKTFLALLLDSASEVNKGSSERDQKDDEAYHQALTDDAIARGDEPF